MWSRDKVAEAEAVNDSGIYIITNVANGNRYVGSARSIKIRWWEHERKLRVGSHRNQHLQHAYNHYGADSFRWEVLEYVADLTRLIEREQYYLDTLNPEYNHRRIAGSQLGLRHRPETIEKMREASRHRRGWKHTDETKTKQSVRKAYTKTPEYRAMMSQKMRERWQNAEWAAMMRSVIKPPHRRPKPKPERKPRSYGPMSPETKERMRQAHLGRKLSPEHVAAAAEGQWGLKRSPEARRRMSEAQKRRFARDGYQRSSTGQFQSSS